MKSCGLRWSRSKLRGSLAPARVEEVRIQIPGVEEVAGPAVMAAVRFSTTQSSWLPTK